VLLVGVLAASCSSILVRYAQHEGVASVAIAAWRMLLASLVLVPLAAVFRRGEIGRIGLRDARLATLAGAFLAAHFIAWISSLEYTSVASSAALVTTNPVWVGLATVFLFKERLGRLTLLGIGTCLAGCLLIIWADTGAVDVVEVGSGTAGQGRQPTFGNLLALTGAVAVSAYLLTGRSVAARFSLLVYVTLVYAAAAIALLLVAAVAGLPLWGYSEAAWWALAGLAVGPQLVGHTAFNWSLRRLSPTFVALAILGEPVGSAILAGLLFAEVPSALQAAAFFVLLCGIVIAALGERRSAAAPGA
jgi:drug/metabolite transporter (DMT)-like permease